MIDHVGLGGLFDLACETVDTAEPRHFDPAFVSGEFGVETHQATETASFCRGRECEEVGSRFVGAEESGRCLDHIERIVASLDLLLDRQIQIVELLGHSIDEPRAADVVHARGDLAQGVLEVEHRLFERIDGVQIDRAGAGHHRIDVERVQFRRDQRHGCGRALSDFQRSVTMLCDDGNNGGAGRERTAHRRFEGGQPLGCRLE